MAAAGTMSARSHKSSMGASNTTTYDNYTPAQRAQLAEAGASFKVYANITSHLVSGSFSNGATYTTAAGRGGYIDGNTTIEVGRLQQMAVQVETVLLIKDQNRPTLLIPTTTKNRGNYLAGILSGWRLSRNCLGHLYQREY